MELKTNWGLRTNDFIKEIREGHPRKRERWLAIFWLSEGVSQAEVARRLRRTRETIQLWKESFEKKGSKGIEFCRTGGKRVILTSDKQRVVADCIATKRPKDVGLKGIRWTLKRVAYYCKQQFGKTISIESCRRVLHRNNVVIKRPKKN